MEINQFTLKAIFLSLMNTARMEKIKVENKYYELENWINEDVDISVTDMVDNIENVYKLIEKPKELNWIDIKSEEDFRSWINEHGAENLEVSIDDDQLVVMEIEDDDDDDFTELFRLNIGKGEGLLSKYLLLHFCEEEGVAIHSD